MTRTAVIIQARMTSTRLPGKVVMDLAGYPVLAHVLTRCNAIPGIDRVCCAVPDDPASEPIEEIARQYGATVFRGSEDDVLDRYYQAARVLEADTILRVTSDCPLIDPEICARVLALLADEDADFACNNMPPSWPHGLDCEAVSFEWLERARNEAKDAFEREHVSPYIRTHADAKKVNLEGPGGDQLDQRWTLDYPEDLEFFRALMEFLPPLPAIPGSDEIMAAVTAHPELAAINRVRHDTRAPSESEPA